MPTPQPSPPVFAPTRRGLTFGRLVGLWFAMGCLALPSLAPPRASRLLANATGDSIERAAMDTEDRLAAYTRTGDPGEMRARLLAYHGDAPGTQVMLSLEKWSLAHQSQFLTLLEGLAPGPRRRVLERLVAEGTYSSGPDDPFRRAFAGYRSLVLTELDRMARSETPPHRPPSHAVERRDPQE